MSSDTDGSQLLCTQGCEAQNILPESESTAATSTNIPGTGLPEQISKIQELSSASQNNEVTKPSMSRQVPTSASKQVSAQTVEHRTPTDLCLKEFEPLTDILSHIPQKVQRGLKTNYEPLELTALDANQYFIALGSNIGTVFLFDRAKQEIQRLKSESSTDIVTCVSLHHGLDDLVAIGYSSGSIYIFQLPSIMIGHSKQLERFKVGDVHQDSLTCLAWSTNGMRLFSGDSQGCVGCTEVDFYEGKSQSCVLLIESSAEIVQLHHSHRALLVSTKHRCFVVEMDKKEVPKQIGSKDRKILGEFGACFIPAMCKPEDAQLFAARPGYRMWKASINGTVLQTYIFKDLIAQHQVEIPLLHFQVTNIEKYPSTNQFGPLHLFRDKMLVSWDSSCLYVINPEDTSIVGLQRHIGRIKYVAVSDGEIFVLRLGTDRNLIRISDRPISRPTSQLLRQLEAERQFKKEHPVIVKQEESAVHKKEHQETKVTKKEEPKEQKTKPDVSPFKTFGENFLDKMKHIGRPSSIIDKVQEKISAEKRSDTKDKHLLEKSENGAKREASPPGLPPVVQLDSPGLLTLEVKPSTDISSDQTVSSVQISSAQSEKEKSVHQSEFRRTGSGASSALARLQEDHKVEENSAPVYRFASVPEEKVHKQRFQEDDSIVFSRKVKKKKKGAKERKSNMLDVESRDSDTISVNSTTSLESSDTVPSIRLSSDYSPVPSEQLEQSIQSIEENSTAPQSSEPQSTEPHISEPLYTSPNVSKPEVSEHVSVPHVKKNSLDSLTGKSESLNAAFDSDVLKTEVKSVESNQTAIDATDAQLDTPVGENTTLPMENQIASHENVCDKSVELQKSDTDQTFLDTSGLQKPKIDTVSEYRPSLSVEDSKYVEREISRQSCDSKETYKGVNDEKESSLSDSSYNFEYRSEAEQRLYQSIIGTSKDEDKEREIVNSYIDSDSHYTPSNLEKELSKLEFTTMQADAAAATAMEQVCNPTTPTASSSTRKSGPPSIYTIYSKPGATAEDFYSKYVPTSPTSPTGETISDFEEESAPVLSGSVDDSAVLKDVTQNSDFLKSVNQWIEVSAQGNIYSISVTNTHAWITDRSWNIFYSPLNSYVVSWKKANGQASQISVSPDGNILWTLARGIVNVGTKITTKRPEGLKWVEAVRDVAYIAVDNTCAWYIKTNHQVMLQKGLSKDRPFYTSQEVECSHRLKQISCRAGVVWALTDSCQWVYRAGITAKCPEGKEWRLGDSGSDNRLFSCLALRDDNYGWALDIVGQVWFCSGVTSATPRGDKQWWQVPLSGEYVSKDMTALEMLKSFSQKFDPQKLSMLLSTQNGGLIAACSGVWVCPEYKHIVQVCKGSIEGQQWREAHPKSLHADPVWKNVVASNASNPNGVVWAQQPNGDLFTFTPDRENCSSIPSPPKHLAGALFVCVSACTDALWGLTDNGDVFIREGMSEHEPKGSNWHNLDLSQLDDHQLVHISCSGENVWAVDSDGMVWHRIGVKAPSDRTLNAAWLPVDNGGTVFTQVVAGRQDWKVWAVDNRRQVYVRKDITPEMPIGRKWIHVPGSPVMQITLSDNFVFALNHAGELLYRYGVDREHITGDYWKKLPGELTYISATPTNILWGINKDGQLVQRNTKYIVRADPLPTDPSVASRSRKGSSIGSEEGDWELL